jgi:hypothetical protein
MSGKGHDISNEPDAAANAIALHASLANEAKVKKRSIFSRSRKSSTDEGKNNSPTVPTLVVDETTSAISPFTQPVSPFREKGQSTIDAPAELQPVSSATPQTGEERKTTVHRGTLAKITRSHEEKVAQIEGMLQDMIKTGMSYIALLPTVSTTPTAENKAPEERSCRFFLDGIELKIEAVNHVLYESVRKIYGVSEAEIADSIIHKNGMTGGVSKGKSGSFIFFTRDLKFVLKSLTSKESDLLEYRMIPEYAKYVEMFPHTLIPRLLGTYKISMPDTNQIWRIMVMNNVLETSLYIHERYDLKGSIVGRAASAKELAKYGKETVMKDLDFKDNGRVINLSRQTRFALLLQIENDIKFLKDLGIMDYSLFVGIHLYGQDRPPALDGLDDTSTVDDMVGELKDAPSDENIAKMTLTHIRKNSNNFEQLKAKVQAQASHEIESQDSSESRTVSGDFTASSEMSPQKSLPHIEVPVRQKFQSLFKVDDGGLRARLPTGAVKEEHYFIGIIDILQTYDMSKVLETGVKSIKHNKDKLSSVEPEQYMERFLAYVKTIIQ